MVSGSWKRKWRWSLSVVLLALVVGLAACSPSGSNSGNSEDAAENAAENAAEDVAKEPETRGKVSSVYLELSPIPEGEGTPEDNRWVKYLNENGPVDVTFVPIAWAQQVEKLNTMFASGTAPDIIWTNNTPFQSQLINQGLVMPLDELIEKHSTEYKALLEKYPAVKKVTTGPDGKMYKIAGIRGMLPNHAMFIRDDWLKKLNLDIPETTEELFEVAKAFTERDPDGNGQKDTLGIQLSFLGTPNIGNMFENVNNSGYVLRNGQLMKAWNEMEATTSFQKQLFDAGVVDPNYLVDKGEKALQDFVTGKLGIYFANDGAGASGYNVFKTFKTNNPNGSFTSIPLPRSEFGQFAPNLPPPYTNSIMVNSNAKNPEAVMKFIDFMVSLETGKTLMYGEEGVHWSKEGGINGCPKIIDNDKFTKEVSWNSLYYGWLFPSIELGSCQLFYTKINENDPLQSEFIALAKKQIADYLSPDRPIAGITHRNYMPILPDELQVIESTANKTINDILSKAIVSGSSYTVEQAMQDARNTWNQTGGAKVDEWYAEWYRTEHQNTDRKSVV